jgi:hypothetical protein
MKPDNIRLFVSVILIISVISCLLACTHSAKINDFPEICFTSDILPVFSNNCSISTCHDGTGRSRLILNNYQDIKNRIVPGNADRSRLYKAIIGKGEGLMPPDKPLSIENRTKIRIWIEQGALFTTCADTMAIQADP